MTQTRETRADLAGVSELIAGFQATLPYALDSFQVEAIAFLESHRGVLVSAPTSSGKTVVADYAAWRTLGAPAPLRSPDGAPHAVIYTTPLKALSNQKYHDLCARHGASRVGLVTGEHTINDGAPVVVMTTEILRNVVYEEPQRLDVVRDVVLDEIHYIDDHPRGTVWEEIIVQAPKHIRFIGLSATISNVDEVAQWMSSLRGPVATVVRTERPVELRLWMSIDNRLHPLFDQAGNADKRTMALAQDSRVGDPRARYLRRAPDNDMLQVVEELRRAQMLPAIYFIFSRRGCREALARCAVHGVDLTDDEEKRAIDDFVTACLTMVTDEDERQLIVEALQPAQLRRGVSMHHAGMLPSAKEVVEGLFLTGLVKVVFATETLSLGLNMPARSCVIGSFTKFDGTGFHALTSAELTQLMGRAGRRGIDILGHGVILEEFDVDIRDIYDAALGAEMSVQSKFAPTYSMTLSLLRRHSVAEAEQLLELSFGQWQNLRRSEQWTHRERNLRDRSADLMARRFQHPRVRCTERTLERFLFAEQRLGEAQAALRRIRRDHWRDSRRGRYGARSADPGGRLERLRREAGQWRRRTEDSPCHHCPLLGEHRANHAEVAALGEQIEGGEDELLAARERYRTEFRAFRAVLHQGGYLEADRPTPLGGLAAALYGEAALLLALVLSEGGLDELTPAELSAVLVMLVAEDRGPQRPPGRRRFPTRTVEHSYLLLRSEQRRLAELEASVGLQTLRPLSLDYVDAAYWWTEGAALSELQPPPGADVGDVVKAIKNLYSMLRQLEHAIPKGRIHTLATRTRERVERDLIRRV